MADKIWADPTSGIPEGYWLQPDGTYAKTGAGGRGGSGPGGTFLPKGNALVTVISSARTLTQLLATAAGTILTIPTGALTCRIQPRGGTINYTDGTSAPVVAGLGTDIFDGQCFLFEGVTTLAAVQLIAAVSTPCNLSFYG